ncbi:hypothetical protein Tco_1424984, partial [Tanacetum coccineum]
MTINLMIVLRILNVKSVEVMTMIHMVITRRGEAPQAKKAEVFQAKKAESSNATRSKTPSKSGCSRHMTCLESYLHKYVEQSGPKVVFGDDSTCTTEGYGSIKCNGISDEKKGIIFNSNKEVIMIAPRVRDVYQVNSNVVQYIEPYKKTEPSVTEANASLDHDQANQTDQLDQNDLMDQNDHPVQADEILNNDQPEHSNHNNDNHIIDNLPNTKDVQITEPLSSPTKDTSAPNIISSIQTESPSSIQSIAYLAPQDRWSKDKHIELVNII